MAEYDQRITHSTHTSLQNRLSGTAQRTSAGIPGAYSGSQSSSQSAGFSNGQLVRGQVIDLRGHEVKVQLDDSRVLSGRIDDSASLSIGARAVFQVTKADARVVSLKVVSDPRASSQETTIDKALDAALLPKSDRNVSAVRTLLEQGLSVDKNSIQNLLRQSAALKGVSFQTLAILQKHQIPATQVNAAQLEKFLNYEHRIVNLAEQTALELVDSVCFPAPADVSYVSALHAQILDILLPEHADAPSAANVPLSSLALFSPDELLQLLDTLEPLGLSEQDSAALIGGSVTLGDAARIVLGIAEQLTAGENASLEVSEDALGSSFETGDKTDTTVGVLASTATDSADTVSDQAATDAAPPNSAPLGQAAAAPALSLFRSLLQGAGSLFGGKTVSISDAASQTPLPLSEQTLSGLISNLPDVMQTPEIYTLLNTYITFARGSLEVASVLPKKQREELAGLMKGRLPSTVLQKLKDGDLTTAQLLRLLADQADNFSDNPSFLSSEAYRELLRQWLENRFTIRPNDLKKHGTVADYYEDLDRRLAKLEKLPQHNTSQTSFQDSAAGIRDNIDFMKTLNQLFPYIQLPLQLSGQNIHAELFVYTKKEQLARDPSSVRVLLHLDMEQLGPMDIHLSLEQKNVQASFYLQNAGSASVASENLSWLSSALSSKGYLLDARIKVRDAAADPIRSMLLPHQDSLAMKRYTFDIRA